MKTHTSTTTLATLALLTATVLTGVPAATAATGTTSDPELPPYDVPSTNVVNDRQMMDPFRSEWGQTEFEPSGITDWVTATSWDRAAQYAFAPGTDETSGTPTQETGLAPLHMDVVTRDNNGRTEYEVRETAENPGQKPIVNYFPVFSGTPETGMTFYNAAGIPGLPSGEIQQTCRGLDSSGQNFLVCRMIASDASIHYQIKVAAGSPTDNLPDIKTVMRVFRDQRGVTSFKPSGATPWKSISQWRRIDGVDFNKGDDETHGTPVDWETTGVGLDIFMMMRTVNGEKQYMERDIAVLPDGSVRQDGFVFGRFSGGPTDWFEQESPIVNAGEYRQHRKIVTIGGKQYLDDRTLRPQADGSHVITYYLLRPVN